VVISAGTVTRYKNNVYFYGEAVGSLDWNGMTEIPAGLNAPANLNAEASGYNIVLSWDSVSVASSYRIYRSGTADGTYNLRTSSSTASYSDSNIPAGTTYYYKVSTVDSSGNESPKSSAAFATVAGEEETLTGPVSITGTAKVGETLMANTSLNGSGTISYQWLRDGSIISGATGQTYTLASSDKDAYIKVRVSRSGMSGSVESSPVGPVAGSESGPGPGGGDDTLTVNGYSGVISAFVTTTTISQENYNSVASGSFAATGSAASGSAANLIWQGGNSKNGTYNVLLATSDGYRYQNGVSFSDGSATVNYSGMTIITIEGGGLKTGSLTINGLPGGDTFAVYVFASGTDISTVTAAMAAFADQSWQALGAMVTSGNTFTLAGVSGSEPADFDASGNLPVLLLNSAGSLVTGSTAMYSWASVNFSNGSATVSYSSFTEMFMSF
jgi:hypothetical protein